MFLKKILSILLETLFPPQCIACKQLGSWLCNSCSDNIVSIKQQSCYKCGRKNAAGETCEMHQQEIPHSPLDGLIVAAHYSGNPLLKRAIKTFKYQQKAQSMGVILGRKMAKPFELIQQHSWIIIPVPLHPLRQKERGFNQAEVLANQLLKKENTNHSLNTETLKRIKNTSAQARTSSRQSRQTNMKQAFKIQQKITPTSYLLVDDVCSSGATMEACCQALKQAGAKQVWGICLARNI